MKTYEYRFVRLGEYRGSALFGVEDETRKGTRTWCASTRTTAATRTILARGIAAFGAAKYYELIFERESVGEATAP